MGFRKGFFFGFLIGSAAASVKSPIPAEAPAASFDKGDAGDSNLDPIRSTINLLRRTADEALEVGREAAKEREEELQREFDEMRRGRPDYPRNFPGGPSWEQR